MLKKEKTTLQVLKAIKKMHIYQLENKNQFILELDGFKCFQSYNSLIAIHDCTKHTLLLGCHWDYSNTTKKHLYIFINEYCYLNDIENALYNSSNKTKTINKLIKDGLIAYDPEMK